ncbi:MAG: hypothetical protein OEX19_08155 [Gammaproteobacteria bacterium]|nr:hypothetical protein [Gammaproteobacteria bacterium]
MITQEFALQNAVSFIESIKKHLGLSHAQIAQMFDPPIEEFNPTVGMTWEFESNIGTVAIAQANGDIISYLDADDLENIEKLISVDDAEKAVRRFLAKFYNNFDDNKFDLTRKEFKDGRFEFEFTQKKLAGEQSIFTNFVSIEVRGDTPRIVSFDRSALDFVRTKPLIISRDEAMKRMQSLVRTGGKLTTLSVYEQPVKEATSAVTVWAGTVEYNIDGIVSLDLIMIDADTGAVVNVDDLEPAM